MQRGSIANEAGLVVIVVAASVVVAGPGSAAVRTCAAPISGGIVRAQSEAEGRKKALDAWAAMAQRAGAASANWRLADKRVLGCTKAAPPSSGFECIAFAAPCTIAQVPGAPPKRRLRPSGRAVPFEV